MKIHLVRHGEVHNPDNVIYERLEGFHLSERGFKMAELTAKMITDDPDMSKSQAIFSSPLLRTRQTAEPISKSLKLTIQTTDNLIESMCFLKGKAKGFGKNQVHNPKNFIYFLNPMRPTWGEAYENIASRMKRQVDQVLATFDNDANIIFVSHQSPIWRLRMLYENRPLFSTLKYNNCSLASITTLNFDDKKIFTSVEYRENELGKNKP